MGRKIDDSNIPCARCKVYEDRKENNDWLTEADIPLNYPRGRMFIFLENRILGHNISKLGKVWRGVKGKVGQIRQKARSAASSLRRTAFTIAPGGTASVGLMQSNVFPLHIPSPPDMNSGWKRIPIFDGQTAMLREFTCHASVLRRGETPHPPHTHGEEEILLLFSGELDIICPDGGSAGEEQRTRLKPGQFVYYPAGFTHTIQAGNEDDANYMMFKWRANRKKGSPDLGFSRFNMFEPPLGSEPKAGFLPQVIFERKTDYLAKLHCHVSRLSSGSGYAPHADPYDVAIVVLEGEVETMDRIVKPHGVVFYAAGEPHGMRNPGRQTARYIVFEFHA